MADRFYGIDRGEQGVRNVTEGSSSTATTDVEEEINKLNEELIYIQGFLKSVQAKLSNERFVAGAPEKVLQIERQKEADAMSKIATIEQSLAGLKK